MSSFPLNPFDPRLFGASVASRAPLTIELLSRYHKTHGHSTQQLHENGDGTFSIVNPETSAPYPGTLGMEKEKPFKCEVCGKRYKNLNGLKYVSSCCGQAPSAILYVHCC